LEFLDALRKACTEVENLEDKGNSSKTAAIYGMAAKIPDKTVVEEVAYLYLDACYSMPTNATENEEKEENTEEEDKTENARSQ
jgi:hypothetical protein